MREAEFEAWAVEVIDRFDPKNAYFAGAERGLPDLTPFEKWLLKELYYENQTVDNLIKQNDEGRY